MPQASHTEHKAISDTGLPYISNSSVTSIDPQYVQGSQNIMTSLREWSENRPGFSTLFDPTQFVNLQRSWIWQRWAGTTPNGGAFVWMGCDIVGGKSLVYKKVIGIDPQAVLLFTSTSSEPFDFIDANNQCFFGNATDMQKYDTARLTTWGGVAPVSGPGITLIAGALNVYTSYCYCCTYWDATDKFETSPSPISACSGIFANKSVNLDLTASTNPRFNGIRVYRTPDGGAQDPTQMQEIAGSPFPNATATVTDTTLDVNLSTRVAAQFFRNDPPTPCKGFVGYGGRIWGFNNNTTFYSGFEEISGSVNEECWPGGLAGNFYPWAKQVNAHASLLDGIAVFTAERISKIEGDSLDTFRRYTLLEKRGTRSRTTVASLGGSVVWLDTSNTIWLSDLGEIGVPIRPDTLAINPATCWISLHISGLFHWVMVLDGSAGKLFVYDLDRKIWMPPWTVGPSSAMFSGETSEGNMNLLLARGKKKVLQLTPGSYLDDVDAYSPIGITNLFPLSPEGNPSWQGTHDWTEIKTDSVPPTQVLQMVDDDPDFAPYTDISANAEPSPLLAHQGVFLQSWRYPATPKSAAFVSIKFVWPGGKQFHVYNLDLAFHPAGG